MKDIPVQTTIKLTADDLCKAISLDDVIGLISHVANHFEDKKPMDFDDRRLAIISIEKRLSEHGRRFIWELAGLIYARNNKS